MRGIVILALTAYAMKGDEQRVLAAGCDGYVPKPIATRAFPGVIARYLAAGSGADGEDRSRSSENVSAKAGPEE
jgi:CheY-like chemotaxis protein